MWQVSVNKYIYKSNIEWARDNFDKIFTKYYKLSSLDIKVSYLSECFIQNIQ